jgi:AbrB family looped-hinge helix DNA binding protein
MQSVKVGSRGQVTIPAALRRELRLNEESQMTIMKIGDVLVLTPRKLKGDIFARKAARAMKQSGLRLENLLEDLEQQRDHYNREHYGG